MTVLDRVPSPPSDSHRFPLAVAGVPSEVEPRAQRWNITPDYPLDQGEQGACIGFGCSAELSAEPVMHPTGTLFAFELYELARAEDQAMGYRFDAGATMLAGLRAMRKLGLIQGYAWAHTAREIRDAVIAHGPVVMGTEWLAGMDSWDQYGRVLVGGEPRGGHCWTIIGYQPAHPVHGAVFECINSWGPDWGINGRFLLPESDLPRLLDGYGEAAIVTDTPLTPVPDRYFAARWSAAFHVADHWWIGRHRTFPTRDHAITAGLRPCRICRP